MANKKGVVVYGKCKVCNVVLKGNGEKMLKANNLTHINSKRHLLAEEFAGKKVEYLELNPIKKNQ